MALRISQLKIAVIGRGRVGLSLYRALKEHRFGRVVSLSHKAPGDNFGSCNVLILAVPDSTIGTMAKKIAYITFEDPSIVLAHTSGLLLADELAPVKLNHSARIQIASMHPLQTFSDRKQTELRSIFFAIEGDRNAILCVRRIIELLGARHFLIRKEQKAIYHAGAVVASNFSVALMQMAVRLLSHLGKKENEALTLLRPIVLNTLHNIFSDGISKSLTGPAARRDFKTLRIHKKMLRQVEPLYISAYNELTKICLSIPLNASKKGRS